jgi:hypothetical protein
MNPLPANPSESSACRFQFAPKSLQIIDPQLNFNFLRHIVSTASSAARFPTVNSVVV